jgi:hypothetical protein
MLFVDYLRPVFFAVSLLKRMIVRIIAQSCSISNPIEHVKEGAFLPGIRHGSCINRVLFG